MLSVYLVYFVVIIVANTIGAISGMGGGVIIKPVFDTLGYHSLEAIAFYSCVAVFTMSIASTYKQVKNGFEINWLNAIAISLGSIIGGILGSKLFNYLLSYFGDQKQVQFLQIILTILSLLLVLVYTLKGSKNWQLKSLSIYVLVGVFLGGFSTLLGIGGGPINVTLLIVCFSLTMKEATVYSIITIFFSQLAKLVEIGMTSSDTLFDLNLLYAIVPAALIGGYVGGLISSYVTDKWVSKLFVGVVCLVILINLYNGWQLFV